MTGEELKRDGWISQRRRAGPARVRLLCLPFAGGGTSTYSTWAPLLPDFVELCLAQLPGRELRFRERPMRESSPILSGLEHALRELPPLPLVVFGHSMGGLLAYELARRLDARGDGTLAQLVVSARRPPHLPRRNRLHDLPEPEFLEAVRRLNGTPAAILAEPELMALLMPVLRADLQVDETHVTQPGAPLRCPLLVLGGRLDSMAPPESLLDWAPYTTGRFRRAVCEGDHFFVQKDRPFVLREVGLALGALAGPGSHP